MRWFKKKIAPSGCVCFFLKIKQKIRMATTWQAKKRRRAFPATKNDDEVLQSIRKELRIVQNITGCSTTTLNLILRRLQPFLKGCENLKVKNLHVGKCRRESPVKLRLHGCVGCENHVFAPSDIATECPQCGHPRFDDKGNPYEVFLDNIYNNNNPLLTSFTHSRYAGTFRFESS